MKDKQTERKPAEVPEGAKQAGEIRDRWSWVEPSAWTERMLAALENGVKGGKWFALGDKVYSARALRAAFAEVKANGGAAGVDHVTVEMFEQHLEENVKRLMEGLRKGEYRPAAVKRVWIPKPGSKEKRPLGIPTVRDRVVQGSLRNVLEPIFEKEFSKESYGFRPGRGCKDALRRVVGLMRAGHEWIVDADIKGYFDTIPHDKLMERIKEKVADGRVLQLLETFLKQGIMEGMKEWKPEEGTPQGAVISPLLSNIYLDALDHTMEEKGYKMVRYADDFVILCKSQEEAEKALEIVKRWMEEAGLNLHPQKTRIVGMNDIGGFDFLGYNFRRGRRWPRKKSLNKFKDKIRAKTKRTNGNSLQTIISEINRTMKGWFEYFKHSDKTTYPSLDGWIRMRLRSILRKRAGRKGHGLGEDHRRWPNAYFMNHGLFSFEVAYALLINPQKR